MKNPQHFDHSDHTQRLELAAETLEALGKHELAGACRRAKALHFDLIGRVSHAQQALRKFKRIDQHLREARGILERYVAQPEAPWLEPSPVLFPLEETDR